MIARNTVAAVLIIRTIAVVAIIGGVVGLATVVHDTWGNSWMWSWWVKYPLTATFSVASIALGIGGFFIH